MNAARLLCIVLLLAMGAAHAQDAGEIAFWESVRDSKDPVELRAYLDRYPNGAFAPLARSRLARLSGGEKPKPAAAPRASAGTIASHSRTPLVGDSWTYRFSQARLRGQWGQDLRAPETHVVTVTAIESGKIVDQVSIDGGPPRELAHSARNYLATQGVSVFSPYLLAYMDQERRGALGSIEILDSPCAGTYTCTAKGRIAGQETVDVPAGRFSAVKVVIEEEWRAAAISTAQSPAYAGGRTLTVWYVPELRRAVKYSSRPTVGNIPAVEPNFDLELVEYRLK
jgi:hypothetical protein